jgi:2-phospho-L-lactate guanylyltransferase
MTALLIPVKDLRHAKQRLSPLWTQAERTEFAQAMLEDFFAVIRQVQGAERILLASSHDPAIEQARAWGWDVLREQIQVSESASVDEASRWAETLGVTSLLRLPADLPLLEPGDVEWMLSRAESAPSMAIVPSRDGTGTNALLRTPPMLFPSHFGPDSFRKHVAEAERCGARCKLLRHPRLEMDIDDEDDLRAFLAFPERDSATGAWLARKISSRTATVAAR